MGKAGEVVKACFSICDARFDMESLLPKQVEDDMLAILWLTANPSSTQSRSSRSIRGEGGVAFAVARNEGEKERSTSALRCRHRWEAGAY
jgi:hypothetical protein